MAEKKTQAEKDYEAEQKRIEGRPQKLTPEQIVKMPGSYAKKSWAALGLEED